MTECKHLNKYSPLHDTRMCILCHTIEAEQQKLQKIHKELAQEKEKLNEQQQRAQEKVKATTTHTADERAAAKSTKCGKRAVGHSWYLDTLRGGVYCLNCQVRKQDLEIQHNNVISAN